MTSMDPAKQLAFQLAIRRMTELFVYVFLVEIYFEKLRPTQSAGVLGTGLFRANNHGTSQDNVSRDGQPDSVSALAATVCRHEVQADPRKQ